MNVVTLIASSRGRSSSFLSFSSHSPHQLLNAVGDYLLVLRMGKGVVGAAVATVAAQAATAAVLLRAERRANRRRLCDDHYCDGDNDDEKEESVAGPIDGADTAALLQAADRSVRDRVRGAVSFLRLCVSPALALVGKLTVVLTVSATASACGTLSLAAHQVVGGRW